MFGPIEVVNSLIARKSRRLSGSINALPPKIVKPWRLKASAISLASLSAVLRRPQMASPLLPIHESEDAAAPLEQC